MKMMTVLALAILGSATFCPAQQVGIGLSLKQNESSLYFPIRTNGNWFIEPYANYFDNHQSTQNSPSDANSSSLNYSSRSWGLGLGVFWQKSMPERTSIYVGPRIGYISEKIEFNSAGSSNLNNAHGFELIPTLGFEFFPLEHLSLGGEVGYRFLQMNSNAAPMPPVSGPVPTDVRAQQTVSTFLVRYSF